MKCLVCKNQMEKAKYIIEKDGVEFEGFRCRACGEEIMNVKQAKELTNKYKELRKKINA